MDINLRASTSKYKRLDPFHKKSCKLSVAGIYNKFLWVSVLQPLIFRW